VLIGAFFAAEQLVNIVKPFWLTARKCLKTRADGDPNGVAESQRYQRLIAANLAPNAPFRAERTQSDCLTFRANPTPTTKGPSR
jgi:hypothetical protein